MFKLPSLSLYIHIPWCIKKCPYCDFNAHVLKERYIPSMEYVKHLLSDLDADLKLIIGRKISTIFIGGGTPNLLDVASINYLMNGIRMRLPVITNAEVTMEINPGILEENCFIAYQKAGINRMSIGVQTFNKKQLNKLGRTYKPEEAKKTISLVQALKLNSLNIDLMYGLIDQSLENSLEDLRQVIELYNPQHLSWYQLTIEANTLFSSKPPKLPNDNILWNIFYYGNTLLRSFGYQQYEISAYAKPGYQCYHNLNYWRFGDYLGIGCGAHSKLTLDHFCIMRMVKTRHPRGYMQGRYIDRKHKVAKDDLPLEFFMNRFRLLEPMPRIDFESYTGLKEKVIRDKINIAIQKKYIMENTKYWQITKYGKLFLNDLLEIFL
ncbi:radical SAM family heme chaperone HemW [Candidatus Profftia lariciata]|uniref:radical SAM family heme chaperone HemW n=1 Tax=Candidatus Profftia lariciata TaxID=1987921 RepID=UPI001D00AAE2|nr:radical SAM family heme chaperone HemW [Candidatus Profftia lariciata]UDG81513.1 radical SAM family heme chaperone HemW [Candidatus Profftia lariciata]